MEQERHRCGCVTPPICCVSVYFTFFTLSPFSLWDPGQLSNILSALPWGGALEFMGYTQWYWGSILALFFQGPHVELGIKQGSNWDLQHTRQVQASTRLHHSRPDNIHLSPSFYPQTTKKGTMTPSLLTEGSLIFYHYLSRKLYTSLYTKSK